MIPHQALGSQAAPRRDGAPRLAPLLTGTAVLALVLGAGMARGETFIGNGVAFQGYAYGALGNVTLANGNSAGPTDTLTVHTPTAIVDWTPYDNGNSAAAITFLPQGSTGIFQNGPEVSGFTVLNRINPSTTTRQIEFDGHVISQLVGATGAVSRGGNVWFYAPGGIIIGSTGVFDVGSLILTPNTIDTSGDTTLPDPTTGIHFAAAAGSTSMVLIQPGAQINQVAPGSYLAIVAPRITQGGTVTVNGSVGYIAAQAADVTINAGLFNIASAIGSTVATGGETTLTHSGTTTGPAETSSAAPHVIYMIAVPANDAVTLLATGSVGYQGASTATQANGSVVLGAGVDFAANPESYGNSETYPLLGSSAPANIAIPGGSFTSPVNAQATNALTVDTSAGNLSFAGFLGQANGATGLHVGAGRSITSSDELDIESLGPAGGAAGLTMEVDAGATLDVATLLQGARRQANGQTLTFDVNGTVTAGDIDITASRIRNAGDALGGTTTINVAGSLTANSVYVGAIGQTNSGNATGGTAHLAVTGSATIGDLTLAAGTGSPTTAGTQTGGAAQGGSATVDVTGTGRLTLNGTVLLDASADAPSATSTAGGAAQLAATGGTITLGNAEATATLDASATGGIATGGTAALSAGGGGSITAAGSLTLTASGTGGSSEDGSIAGSAATGGATSITARDGAITLANVELDAIATGGDSTGFEGGAATGGTAIITTTDPAGRIMIGSASLSPNGYAGSGLTGAANGRGGTSSIIADGGTIAFTGTGDGDSLSAVADGRGSSALSAGRDPATSGIGYGGTVTMTADEGGSISVAGRAYLSPYATGGSGSADGTGGTAIGGTVTLAALDSNGQPGTISFGSMAIDTGSFGGSGGVGGAATAGTSTILVAQGASIGGTTLDAETYAYGGGGGGGEGSDFTTDDAGPPTTATTGRFSGGAATGGSTTLTVDGGTFAITGDTTGAGVQLLAYANGGAGSGGGAGGAATGSTVSIAVNSGTLSAPTFVANATATGGASGNGVNTTGGDGGGATGGSATLTVGGGSVAVTSLTIGSTATGGAGGPGGGFFDDPTVPTPVQNGFAGGPGGAASGGAATLTLSGGALTTHDLTVAATTVGGDGGVGGGGAGSGTAGAALGGVGGASGGATSNGATVSVLGGTLVASDTTVTSTDNAGTGGGGGLGGTDASGARAPAAAGVTGDARGGGATIETDLGGSASLGATTLAAGGTIGGTIEAGTITLAANDSQGTAPATPLMLDSLSATMSANLTTTGDLIQVTAAAPIAIANDADLSGATLARIDTSGRGTVAVGGALTVDTLEVIGTQTAPTAGTTAITAGSASIDASFAGVTLATLATNGALDIVGQTGVTVAGLTAGGAATLTSGAGAVNATITAAGPITASGTAVTLTGATAPLQIAQATASAGDVTIDTGGDLTATGAITSATGDVDLSAGGAVGLAALSAGDTVTVTAGTTLHAASIAVGTDTASTDNDGSGVFGSLALIAGGAITVDTPFSVTGSIGLVSRTAGIDLGSLTAGANGSVAVLAGGDIRLGTVTAPNLLYVGGPAALAALGNDPTVPEIVGVLGGVGPVASGGAVTIGRASTGTATIAAGTTLTLGGPLTAVTGAATLAAAGDLVAQDVTATGAVSATSSGGATTIGAVTAGVPTIAEGIRLAAMQALTAGPLVASGSISATSMAAGLLLHDVTSTGGGVTATAGGGDIALGTVRAAGSITVAGTGRITAGDLTAGTGPLLPGESGGGSGSTDPAAGGIATGFDGTAIERCDDCSTDSITLPFSVNYFGQSYSTTYVSNNGYLTFNEGQGTYTPSGLGTGYSGLPIIAAFFADVDTRSGQSGLVTYGSGTFAGRQAFGATWNGVGYYSEAADKLNNFQIILTNRSDTGAGNFDIYYNYTNIGWETGAASGGVNGFGGTSAAVGYNAGTGDQAGTFFELPGSRVPGSFINGGTAPLITTTNDGIAGQLLFTVRNGQVSTGVAAEPPSIHVSNLSGGGTSDIQLGNLSAEGAEVHGTGRVTVGTVNVGDRGSGVTATGQAFATVLDAGLGLSAGNVTSTGLIVLGSRTGDVSAGAIAGGASVMALADGSVTLRTVTTGTGAGDTLYVGGAATDALTGFDFATLLSGRSFDPATLATLTPAAAGGTIDIAGPIATGNLRAAATGAVTLADASATGSILIDGGAGIATGALTAGGTIDLAAAAGGIATGALGAAGDVTATGSGDVALGAITGGNVSATSGGGSLTIGATNATGAVTLAAARTLSVASIDGTGITLGSADIAIAASATIGSTRTTSVVFRNTGAGRTAIGDDTGAAAGDYQLSAAELATVHGNAIGVASAPTQGSAADVLIGDLTLGGSAQTTGNLLGSNAGFTVTSAGAIRIVGAAHFTGFAVDNTVTIRSTGGDITGVLPAGSITLDNGSGVLAGTLALDAGTILFATPDVAGAVGSATTPAAIDTALGASGTLANPAGYLRADTVSVRFADAFYTQNSGASSAVADRAGVTAGGGGIVLTPTTTEAADPAHLVLNAQLVQNGQTLTGNQVFNALKLQSTGYAGGATLNGCLLDATDCGQTLAVTALIESIQPVQDVVAQVRLDSSLGNVTAYSFTTPALITSIDLTPPTLAPQIDEPVTGAGNDSLWVNIGIGRELAPMGGKPADAPKP